MDGFGENIKKVLLAGIGAVAITTEKSKDLLNEMVKKGELTVEQGKVLNEELKHNMSEKLRAAADSIENAGKKAADAASDVIENAAGKAGGLLDKVADMTAEERAALKEKLQELDQQDDATKNEE